MISVHSKVTVLEVQNKAIDLIGIGGKDLLVESHWNDNKLVVLTLDDVTLTVCATDLQQAISNATNSNRFG